MMMNIVNRQRMYYSKSKGYTRQFNCWGATTYVLEIHNRLNWLDVWTMEQILEDRTEPVKGKIKIGDILVLRDNWDELQHTAIYIGGGKYYHKKGSDISEYCSLNDVLSAYKDYATKRQHRRLI